MTHRRHRRPAVNALIGIAALVVAIAPIVQKDFFTCATCGDKLRTTSVLGLSSSRDEEVTECGVWFRQHVEPEHTHTWCRGTYAERTSLIGIPICPSNVSGWASGPVVVLGSGLKLAMYRRSAEPRQVRDRLLALAHWDLSTPEAARRQSDTLKALGKWAEDGCHGGPLGAVDDLER